MDEKRNLNQILQKKNSTRYNNASEWKRSNVKEYQTMYKTRKKKRKLMLIIENAENTIVYIISKNAAFFFKAEILVHME